MSIHDFPGQDRVALRIALAGLHQIASWNEGPVVNSSFDEPGSAKMARHTIELIEARFPWTRNLRRSDLNPTFQGDPV